MWNALFSSISERVRPGYCPRRTDWGGLLGACAPQCNDDSDCDGRQKCCHQGCGLKCVDPLSMCLFSFHLCNSYTMGCPPVRGDNPQALAHGLSPRTGGQTWYNYFIPPTSV